MKKANLFLAFLCLGNSLVFAQTSELTTAPNSKNALSVIILDNNGAYMSDLKHAAHTITIPSKYAANKIDIQFLSAASTPYAIQQKLDEQKVANQILAKLYNGEHKTSKSNLIQAKNAGKELISNYYIQIIDIRNLISMEAFYNSEDANNQTIATADRKIFKPVERVKNGWKGEMVSYLYRITPSAADTLFDKLWILEEDNAHRRSEKKATFEKTKFETSFVMAVDGVLEESQYNTGNSMAPSVQKSKEELFSKLINSAVTNSLSEIEDQFEPFKTLATVASTKPITAKIGLKEKLYVDQSFYITEKVENSKGEIVSKKNAVVRVCKVGDNTMNENTASNFHQTAGSKIAPGMLMQERNEIGLGISLGQINSKEIGGGYLKLEQNLAVLSNLLCKEKAYFKSPQVKFIASFAMDEKDYNDNTIDTSYTYSFKRVQVGLSKGVYFARYFSFAPFIAFGVENTKLVNANNRSINTTFLNYGASASVNISHNAQLVFTLNNFNLLSQPTANDIPKGLANRKGLTYDLGLRIEL